MINLFKVRNSPKVITNIERVLKSGMVGEGPRVEEFKSKLEKRFDNPLLLLMI